jgi:hypothetical protein
MYTNYLTDSPEVGSDASGRPDAMFVHIHYPVYRLACNHPPSSMVPLLTAYPLLIAAIDYLLARISSCSGRLPT